MTIETSPVATDIAIVTDSLKHVLDRVAAGLARGETMDQIEAALERERRDELAAMDRDHRRRMWVGLYIPFAAGMAGLAWTVGALSAGWPEWSACLSLPIVAWSQMMLALAGQEPRG